VKIDRREDTITQKTADGSRVCARAKLDRGLYVQQVDVQYSYRLHPPTPP